MKNALTIILLCLAICHANIVHAQYSVPPNYTVTNLPGATLTQIIDTMYAHADVNDTEEGGEMDQAGQINRSLYVFYNI